MTDRPGAPSSWRPTAVFFDLAGTLFSDRALRDAHLDQLRFVAATIGVDATGQRLRAAYRRGMAESYGGMGVDACLSAPFAVRRGVQGNGA